MGWPARHDLYCAPAGGALAGRGRRRHRGTRLLPGWRTCTGFRVKAEDLVPLPTDYVDRRHRAPLVGRIPVRALLAFEAVEACRMAGDEGTRWSPAQRRLRSPWPLWFPAGWARCPGCSAALDFDAYANPLARLRIVMRCT